MRNGINLKVKLKVRWTLWILWVIVWPVIILKFVTPDFLPLLFFSTVWILGGWFGFIYWGPGRILGRVWAIQEARKQRLSGERDESSDTFMIYMEDNDSGHENQEDDDILFGYIINEGGKSGDDYRIVPSDVRKWFPPYRACDGIVTVHEDSYGVGPDWIDPLDPMFGEPNMWAEEDDDNLEGDED